MRNLLAVSLLTMASVTAASPALAQQFSFVREFAVTGPVTLDVTTLRGAIEVLPSADGRAVVDGTASVRVGWNVPANAVELARAVAAAPPVVLAGDALRLDLPTDRATQQAVTVSYKVRVPRDTVVTSVSESGETVVRGIAGRVQVRTQSGAIELQGLAGDTRVTTGSGDVTADAQSGALHVTTSSSRFTGTQLSSSLRVQSQSGEVNATFAGNGDAHVETSSSAIRLSRLQGALVASTQSGRVIVSGAPRRDWSVTTGSSSVEIELDAAAGFALDAVTRSSSIVVDGPALQGSRDKRAVSGTANGGGPTLRLRTGSGSIRLQQSSAVSRR